MLLFSEKQEIKLVYINKSIEHFIREVVSA